MYFREKSGGNANLDSEKNPALIDFNSSEF